MNETSKSIPRRLRDASYVRWFAGDGIDVGCGHDSIEQWADLFPLMASVAGWDRMQGDAQELPGLDDASFDWLHSSHCLEHMYYPHVALRRWCEVVKPGGHLIVLVPDEDLYEQGKWPPRFNRDHKRSFTLSKRRSWCPASINVFDLLAEVNDLAEPLRVEKLEATYLHRLRDVDQTLNPVTESAIEFVLRRL
jgi:SAM-dependent methyltransferase